MLLSQHRLLQGTRRQDGSRRPFSSNLVTRASKTAAPPAPAKDAQKGAAAVEGPSFKAAIDFKFVKDNVALVTDNATKRRAACDPALVAQLYDEYSTLQKEAERLRAARNKNSTDIKVGMRMDG